MSAFRDLYVVKDLRASRVNLMMNDFAAGLPSPLSFLGLADLLVRNLGLAPWSARVLPILHRVDISEGRSKPEMENKSGIFEPIETMEDLVGSVQVSLLLHLPGCENESTLRAQLQGRRIAGGLIQNDRIDVQEVTADGSAFRGMKRGFAMLRPEQAERRYITSGDTTPEQPGLAQLASLLFPAERPEGFGWIVPAAVGYRLLEDPLTVPARIRTRSKEIPHVFAEPVAGIAELVSVRNKRLTGLSNAALGALMWTWEARGDLVLGHPDYHPVFPIILRSLSRMAKSASPLSLETGMLAFARSVQITEGLFYATISGKPEIQTPIEILEKGVRGQTSQDNAKEKAGLSNPQSVEYAIVPQGHDGVRLRFSARFMPLSLRPHACNNTDVGAAYERLARAYQVRGGYSTLALLYIWNIAIARFAWRNRFQSDAMTVKVESDAGALVFDPVRLSLDKPATRDEMLGALVQGGSAELNVLIAGVAEGLSNDQQAAFGIKVEWNASMEPAQEVFPSQEYVRDEKADKQLSRVFAKLPTFYAGRELGQAS
ncbi:MAG: type I-F CRISPR-associated protein Cas7f/Csy3, partial [Cypionkella sp.]|nr:type I-F CRISPR-associated protein Cas7f/Csy3 [Cypionkella sp.]